MVKCTARSTVKIRSSGKEIARASSAVAYLTLVMDCVLSTNNYKSISLNSGLALTTKSRPARQERVSTMVQCITDSSKYMVLGVCVRSTILKL